MVIKLHANFCWKSSCLIQLQQKCIMFADLKISKCTLALGSTVLRYEDMILVIQYVISKRDSVCYQQKKFSMLSAKDELKEEAKVK